MSCVFAPEITTASGSPFSSVRTLRFVPIFSSVCWILPSGLQGQRCFYHTSAQALPFSSYSFQLVILLQPFAPNLFKKACRLPFLKLSVYCTAASILKRQCLPLATSPQHIKYPLKCFPCWHWLSTLTGGIFVFLPWIPPFFRYFSLDYFPKFI